MAVGFGFSVSDLVTGINLIRDSVEAVRGKKSAPAEYAALLTEIDCLRDGLEAIDDLDLETNGTEKQKAAIERATTACQLCIDEFLARISRYQPHLREGVSGWVSSYHKIQWALCRKQDVAKFRSQLERHTSSINMLIITFQAKESMRQRASQSSQEISKRGTQDDGVLTLLQGLTVEQRACFEMLMRQNQDLLRSLEQLRYMLQVQSMVPAQVLLQPPVILLDAFGKLAPFHLDFIDSSEAFLSVLKIRFRKAGARPYGLQKLDRGEFSIQETGQQRAIDIAKPWEAVFKPGQRVDMSMVFNRMTSRSKCPGCNQMNDDHDGQIDCDGCGLSYRLCVEPLNSESPIEGITLEGAVQTEEVGASPISQLQHTSSPEITSRIDDYNSFEGFRRVLINCVFVFDHDIKFPPQVNIFVTLLEIWLRLSPAAQVTEGEPWWQRLYERTLALLDSWRIRANGKRFREYHHWYQMAAAIPPRNGLLYAYFQDIEKSLIERYGENYLEKTKQYYAISRPNIPGSHPALESQAIKVIAKMFLERQSSRSESTVPDQPRSLWDQDNPEASQIADRPVTPNSDTSATYVHDAFEQKKGRIKESARERDTRGQVQRKRSLQNRMAQRKSRENRETGKAKSAKMDTNQSQWDAEVVDPTRSLQEVRNNHLENLEMDTSREAFIIPSPQEEYDSLEDLMKGISSIGSPRTPSARKVRTQDAWNAQGNKSARTPLKDQVQWTMIDRKG